MFHRQQQPFIIFKLEQSFFRTQSTTRKESQREHYHSCMWKNNKVELSNAANIYFLLRPGWSSSRNFKVLDPHIFIIACVHPSEIPQLQPRRNFEKEEALYWTRRTPAPELRPLCCACVWQIWRNAGVFGEGISSRRVVLVLGVWAVEGLEMFSKSALFQWEAPVQNGKISHPGMVRDTGEHHLWVRTTHPVFCTL